MTVSVETASFVRSHGKEPKGYGAWAFFFGNEPDPRFYPSSTYAVARKAAKVDAKAAGFTVVNVGP